MILATSKPAFLKAATISLPVTLGEPGHATVILLDADEVERLDVLVLHLEAEFHGHADRLSVQPTSPDDPRHRSREGASPVTVHRK